MRQGEHHVSADPEAVLATVLGSCVAVCLHDPARRVGGMNHFLLPTDTGGDPTRHGLHAVEVLLNGLLRAGAQRSGLTAKLFGGARMRDGLGEIGAANAALARRLMEDEGIPCLTASLGGVRARRVRFWPASGRAQQMFVARAEPARPAPAPSGDVTFF